VRPKEIALGGLLTALALLIPLAFRGTFLQFYIPAIAYSATFASHVPSMLAMLVSPAVAGLVGLGSTLGFLVTLGPVIAARAFIHTIWGVVGAEMVRRGKPLVVALVVALPIHAIGEGVVVWLLGPGVQAGLFVAAGTVIHHAIDSIITLALARVLAPVLALGERAA
jgi:niacin transporter